MQYTFYYVAAVANGIFGVLLICGLIFIKGERTMDCLACWRAPPHVRDPIFSSVTNLEDGASPLPPDD